MRRCNTAKRYKINAFDKDKKLISANDNISIIAAHQDDGVITAGGNVIQTVKSGGSVNIFYIFDGETGNGRKGNIVRTNEAYKAWELAWIITENISSGL